MTNLSRALNWEDLTILLPTKNEELSIKEVLEEIGSVSPNIHLLVADSSSDSTPDLAKIAGAKIVSTPPRGKGYAVRVSLDYVHTPYVIMMNADLTYPATHIHLLYSCLTQGYQAVVGYRFIVDKGAMSLLHSFGNAGLSLLASILYGHKVRDVCSGMWGFNTNILRGFPLRSDGFTLEAELLVNTLSHKLEFAQVPIGYRKRGGDSRPKLKASDGLKIGTFLIKERFGRDNSGNNSRRMV